jgi:hypothetical protein
LELRQIRALSEPALRLGAAFVCIVICAFAPARAAGAIGLPTAFNMSPTSGPPGTRVHVSGSGCSPGLLSQSNFVMIQAATVPATGVQLPVHTNGSWSGSFTIPHDARAARAAVSAACVSLGLQSLLTTYRPRTFTVTGNPVPTTLASPLPTTPGTPAATTPAGPGSPTHPGTPNPETPSASVPPGNIDNGSPGGRTGAGSADAGGGGSSTIGTTAERGARAAELSSPALSVSRTGHDGGLGWVLWVLALSVPVAGLALCVWMRRARRQKILLGLEGDAA